MDRFTFQLKRTQHRSVALGRRLLREAGLTPARLDILEVIYRTPEGKAFQSAIRQALGVARVTVSRMLRRLEELGLVTRQRTGQDRRTFMIKLTAEALRRLRLALRTIMTVDPIRGYYERAFGARDAHSAVTVDRLIENLEQIGESLGDTAAAFPLFRRWYRGWAFTMWEREGYNA